MKRHLLGPNVTQFGDAFHRARRRDDVRCVQVSLEVRVFQDLSLLSRTGLGFSPQRKVQDVAVVADPLRLTL
jgi:hypothetical protein